MNIENCIESKFRELFSTSTLKTEFEELYTSVHHRKLKEILMTLHFDLTDLFRQMNERLPTKDTEAHYWAEPSRQLLNRIEIIFYLRNALTGSELAFRIDNYYLTILTKCKDFLCTSGGSSIPKHMDKVELYYKIPIFIMQTSITVPSLPQDIAHNLKQIGSGSYAIVYKYKDTFYNRFFILKRAKKELSEKEVVRFKQEYETMKQLSSPYILEVYHYNSQKNEYIMEYMDYTLEKYITTKNPYLTMEVRSRIIFQILYAFKYLHSKSILHRDISPNNILIKEYDDNSIVVKLSDFGLVKIPNSKLTTVNTEFKGYFNDPSLQIEGFNAYCIQHETYAITRIIYFVLTGRTNTSNINNPHIKGFINIGLNPDKEKRFQDINDIILGYRKLKTEIELSTKIT